MVDARFLLCVMVAALFSAGVAVAQSSSLNQSMLNAAYAQASCKTNFTISLSAAARPYLSAADSSALVNSLIRLKQYSGQLGRLANQSNATGFEAYVSSTYDPQLADATRGIVPAIAGAGLNATALASIRSSYSTLRAQYEQCALSALRAFAQAESSAYQSQLSQARLEAQNLSARGIDASALYADISNASTGIVAPLQSAANSATSAGQLEAALNGYCLYDGCKAGINGHFDARFGFDKLQAILNRLGGTAQDSALSAARADLDGASAILQQAGASRYTASQASTVFADLRNAGDELRAFITGK